MNRFDQEWALVPAAARWLAALAALACAALGATFFFCRRVPSGDQKALYALGPMFLATLVGAVSIALYVLVIGYVNAATHGDAACTRCCGRCSPSSSPTRSA